LPCSFGSLVDDGFVKLMMSKGSWDGNHQQIRLLSRINAPKGPLLPKRPGASQGGHGDDRCGRHGGVVIENKGHFGEQVEVGVAGEAVCPQGDGHPRVQGLADIGPSHRQVMVAARAETDRAVVSGNHLPVVIGKMNRMHQDGPGVEYLKVFEISHRRLAGCLPLRVPAIQSRQEVPAEAGPVR